MRATYDTTVIGSGNHASIEIPGEQLAILGGSKRAPLKITVNGYTYQSTATGVDGKCMVVFPQRDRSAAGVAAGDTIRVTLELDSGYRTVDIPPALQLALESHGLKEQFDECTYSRRKEFCRSVVDAKTEETRGRRIEKVIGALSESS